MDNFDKLKTHKDQSVRDLYEAYEKELAKNVKYEQDPSAIFNAALVGAAIELAKRIEDKTISLTDEYTKAVLSMLKDGDKMKGTIEVGKEDYHTKKHNLKNQGDTAVPIFMNANSNNK